MRRITITDEHEVWAQQFAEELKYKHPKDKDVVSQSCKKLLALINAIEQAWHVPMPVSEKGQVIYPQRSIDDLVEYLKKIVVEYSNLLLIHPKSMAEMAKEFDAIIPADEVSKIRIQRNKGLTGEQVTPDTVLFHELIVQYMRYEYVQSSIYPKYVRRMGIKTCVYCNSQYTITTRNNKTFYQLDHCWPKSRYPYFSSSFYNLQPSCGTCNLYKSDNEMRYGLYTPTIWREQDDTSEDYFVFRLKDDALVRYELSRNNDDLEVELLRRNEDDEDIRKLHTDYQKYFHIDELYAEHKDVIEELVWKKHAYSKDYVESLREALSGLPFDMTGDLSRLLIGNYTEEKDILKRPLSKMVQDLIKQLGLAVWLE